MAKTNKNLVAVLKFFVTIIVLGIIAFILNVAPNYVRNDGANDTKKINLVVNNNNVTKNLKHDIIIEDEAIYISQDDIKNFFDENIYYDSKYNQIITTSNMKIAALPINSKNITVNESNINIYKPAKNIDNENYIPFSEISKTVYNVETAYIEKTNTIVTTSLDRELIYANSSKNNNVKYKTTVFSKTIDKISKGDNVTVVSTENIANGWSKITTASGKVGYVKTNTLINSQKVRDNLEIEKQISGKISLVWDYFSEYTTAPSRTGKITGVNVVSPSFVTLKKQGQGDVQTNIGNQGIAYINWAHNNGYKVWTMVSNSSMKETTSEILNDYKLREKFINNIIDISNQYNFDGINLDFENIYQADKDNYSRLIIELAPRLRDVGKVLSVDVTAPDGSEDWSLCFDRNKIAKVSDYIVFMAYDEYGISSTNPGTTAGYDWVEANINKFITQEQVDANKMILGIPFYTRIWTINGNNVKSETVSVKDVYGKIPSDARINWLEDLKQNYVEYTINNTTYKIWIEDANSIKEKLLLVNKYNLSGASYWEKDRETDDIWSLVKEKLNITD